MTSDLLISFYDCGQPAAECVSVAGTMECSLFRLNEDRLRQSAELVLSVGKSVCRTVRNAVRWSGRRFRHMICAGRRLIRLVCVFRV